MSRVHKRARTTGVPTMGGMRTTKIVLVDDLDGTDADRTVRFSLDGVEYEIDLTDEHATELEAALRPFADAARVVKRKRSRAKN